MKLFKQPWFIIFVFIISVYTYRFYQNPKSLEFSLNTAEATNSAGKDEKVGENKEKMQVNISEFYNLDQVKNFTLSTHYNMDVRFEKSEDDKILFLLMGEGNHYKNNGEKLGDWFDLKISGGDMKMESMSVNSKNFSFKKMFKKGVFDDDKKNGKYVLTISVPESHQFKSIQIESVSSDLTVSHIKFDNFRAESVSGDIKLTQCSGEKINIETVSGDSTIDVAQLKSAEFESVSGDTDLKASSKGSQLSFESVSGDLNLEMPKDTGLDVHFESLTGELSNEFGTSEKPMSSLKFSSLSGSAKVSKIK